MQKAIFTTLAAAVVGTASFFASPAQAQEYVVPQGSMEIYSPGYYGTAPMEADPMATGSILVVPRQMGPAPGQTWIGYCSSRYPTYDQTSNTYWGPDGRQYLCQ